MLTTYILKDRVMSMFRKNFHMSYQQLERLNFASRETGLSSAEIMRRALDNYLDAILADKNEPGREHQRSSRRAVCGGKQRE